MLFHIFLIVLFLSLGVLFLNNSKNKLNRRIYLFIVFAILFILSAFRASTIGNDTVFYSNMFYNTVVDKNVFSLFTIEGVLNSRIEPGYVLFNTILRVFSSNHLTLQIVSSIIILGSWFAFVDKHSENVVLSVLLFFNLRLYYFSISGIRQAIAMAILLISYDCLLKRQGKRFFILVLCASLFHLSAIIFIFMYPLTKYKVNKKFVLTSLIVGLISYFSFDKLMNLFMTYIPKYQMYFSSTYLDGEIKLASIMNFLLILSITLLGLGVFLSNKKRNSSTFEELQEIETEKNEKNEINTLNIIMISALLISFLSIKSSIAGRFYMNFFMFSVIYIPKVLSLLKNKNLRLFLTYVIIIGSVLYNLIILYYRPEWQNVYPYKFIWQN